MYSLSSGSRAFVRSWILSAMLFGIGSTFVHAQSLRGKVTDPTGEPLFLVQVVVPAFGRGTTTDETGKYSLDRLPPGTLEVEFRFVGFKTEKRTTTISESPTVLDVELTEAPIGLGEAVVTAESQVETMLLRSSRSVTVLEPDKLLQQSGQTLGETLSQLPGMTTLSTGPSIAKPVIRGLHSQRVTVMNAGVAQEGQQWGGEHAPEIDPFSMGRVEVIRGAAGVEYGVGAIGGVIRIEPEELPFGETFGGRLSVNMFSNNRQGAGSLMLQGSPASVPEFGWRIQTSLRHAGDSRTPDYVIGNTAFREKDVAVTTGWHGKQSGVRIHLSHFGTTLGLYSGAHIGNYDDLIRSIERGEPAVEYNFAFGIDPPKQEIRHDLVSVSGHTRVGSGDWIDIQYGFQSNRRKEYDAHKRFGNPDKDPAFSLTLESHSLDLKFRQRPRGSLLGVVGISALSQGNRNGETGFLIPNFRANTIGAFAHESWVSDLLTIETGIRYDYRWMKAYPKERVSSGPFVRRTHDFQSLSSVLGATWRFAELWSISMNAGRAWRPPGVNELYNFGVHHGTAQFEVGDPDLTGERSLNVDATLRHTSDRAVLEIGTYVNRMDGYIYLDPESEPRTTIRGTFPSFQYVQKNVVLKGVDGMARYEFPAGLGFETVFSVIRGTIPSEDSPLIYMPADRIRIKVEYRLPQSGPFREPALFATSSFVRKQTRFPEGEELVDPPDGYRLFGAGFRSDISLGTIHMTASLEVTDLLDTAYRDYLSRFRYFIDDPGRNMEFRLTVPFGAGSN